MRNRDTTDAQQRDIEAVKSFNKRWMEIKDVIDYRDEWEMPPSPTDMSSRIGPRIFSAIKDDLIKHLPPGRLFKSMNDSGDRQIFVGTRLGPIMLHVQKFTNNVPAVFVYTVIRIMDFGFMRQAILKANTTDIFYILGEEKGDKKIYNENLGIVIENLYKHFTGEK